jgi:hypothetical protein
MPTEHARSLFIGVGIYLVLTVFGAWVTGSMFAHLDAAVTGQTVTRSDLVWLMVDGGMTGYFVCGLVLTILQLVFSNKK